VENRQGTVVVVEDDGNISDLVAMYLRRDGFRVVQCQTGESGLQEVARDGVRLVVVDIGLPGKIDGFEFCRRLRRDGDVPVLMLTARDDEVDRVLGLELGADDYVTKPFSPRELVARVHAILRRSVGREHGSPDVITVGGVEVDNVRREVRGPEGVVALTTREFDLLAFLARNTGRALSRQQLLDGVWGQGWYGDERTVDVHVRQLRKKLGDALPLATVWGLGYRLG
jgi:DNA-binding response OmpR family regulator